jgi:hypothetical protein
MSRIRTMTAIGLSAGALAPSAAEANTVIAPQPVVAFAGASALNAETLFAARTQYEDGEVGSDAGAPMSDAEKRECAEAFTNVYTDDPKQGIMYSVGGAGSRKATLKTDFMTYDAAIVGEACAELPKTVQQKFTVRQYGRTILNRTFRKDDGIDGAPTNNAYRTERKLKRGKVSASINTKVSIDGTNIVETGSFGLPSIRIK